MKDLENPGGHVFHDPAQDHDQPELGKRAFAETVQDDQDQKNAAAIDGQPGPVKDAPVYKLAGLKKMKHHFPGPAKHTAGKKHQNERCEGIVAKIAAVPRFFSSLFFRDGKQPGRICLSFKCVRIRADRLLRPHPFPVFFFFSVIGKHDPEIFFKESPEAFSGFRLCAGRPGEPVDIRISAGQICPFWYLEQEAVVQLFGAFHIAFQGEPADVRIVFCKRRFSVRVDKQHAQESSGSKRKKRPGQKRKFKEKSLPFVPFHHAF